VEMVSLTLADDERFVASEAGQARLTAALTDGVVAALQATADGEHGQP